MNKVFQMPERPNILEFSNYKRIPEKDLFNNILNILNNEERVTVGEKRTEPLSDQYLCTIDGEPFTLVYDIDHGASIYAESKNVIGALQSFFSNHDW